MRPLLDPRLHQATADLWPSRVDITSLNFTRNAARQPLPGTPITVFANLPCRMAPYVQERPDDSQNPQEQITENYSHRNLKINGYYPSIEPYTMQATVAGVTYQIRGVEADSQSFSTRLNLEIIKP